jgi:glycosyltransferase involved in cell wall biosynthesis
MMNHVHDSFGNDHESRAACMVSIVTICYNDIVGLQRTVDSVNAQSYKAWQHLVVDGASQDGSPEWLEGLPPDNRRIVRSDKDSGIYDAMNIGSSMATGELLMFLNAGDVFADPDVLSDIVEDWRRNGWLWAYGRLVLEGSQTYRFEPFSPWKFRLGLRYVPHPASVASRRLAAEVGSFRLDIGPVADQEQLLRLSKHERPFVMPREIARFAPGGASSQVARRQREMNWHAARETSQQLVFGSKAVDRLVTEALILRTFVAAAWRRASNLGRKTSPNRQ